MSRLQYRAHAKPGTAAITCPIPSDPENFQWLFIMPNFSLVPVDYQPDFGDVSLIPVDHDPFSTGGAAQPVQTQPTPNSPPQQPATGPDLPDVGAPLIGDGGQFSPGVPWANKAADIASKLVGNGFRGAINLAATPGAIMQPNPYPLGSEEAFWYEDQRRQLINKAGPAMAFAMLGAGAPIAESGAVGALGGKPPRLGTAGSSKILPEELAGQTRTQIPDLAVDKGPGQGAKDLASGAAAIELPAPAIAEGGLSTNAPTGKYYSVVREHKLRPESYPGVSRPAHNQEANEPFLQDMAGDDDYARDMRDLGVNLRRTPTGLAPRTPPAGFSWHHYPEEAGLLQLVPEQQHKPGSIFWGVLHPNGRGGYSKWGK